MKALQVYTKFSCNVEQGSYFFLKKKTSYLQQEKLSSDGLFGISSHQTEHSCSRTDEEITGSGD